MMDFNKFIEVDNLTPHDCNALFEEENIRVEINNGRITNLIKEENTTY